MAVYLDHNATTPLHEKVFEAMAPYLKDSLGNASSLHRFGRSQRDAVETAREQIAQLLGAQADQVVFTSGGTEANNLIIKGLSSADINNYMAISAIEHMSVLEPAEWQEKQGVQLDKIKVTGQGLVQKDYL